MYATRRNPNLWSEGPQVGVIAKNLGTPFLPWQQYAADVAGERRPNGEYEYQVVFVSVPRQTGKTTLLRAEGVHTCLVCGRDVFYTAQTLKDARARWDDLVKQIVNTPFSGLTRLSLRGGSETLWFGDVGFRLFAPSAESLHGYTPPKVMLDEIMAHDESAGDLLMGAIGPAQFTIVDKQIWLVSTAGTAESTFMLKWLKIAMAGTARVAGFVWAAPEGMDPFAPETIEAFHPAIGFELNGKVMSVDDVLSEADKNSRAEYERAFLNRWTVTTSHLFPREVVDALQAVAAPPADMSRAVLVYDVAYDQMSSSITVTWLHDGKPHSQVVKAGPGVSWLVDEVHQLADQWGCMIAADDNGPARDVTDHLRARDLEVHTTDSRSFATATARVMNLIRTRGVTYHAPADVDDVMAAAIAGLSTRVSNDGLAFSRKHSVGDVSPAIGMTLGVWFLDREPIGEKPLLDFGAA